MAYSSEWLQFCGAKDAYFICRYNLMQDKEGMTADLAKALTTVDDQEAALRLLLETKPEAVMLASSLAKSMDLAIDTSNAYTINPAREILCHYKSEPWVRTDSQALATAYLAKNDEWHYRRIAKLYEVLNYAEELADFLLICQSNNSLEVQEVADNFHRVQN